MFQIAAAKFGSIRNDSLSGLTVALALVALILLVVILLAIALHEHERAVARADRVVVTARDLYEEYAGRYGDAKVVHLPNGVDYDFFQVERGTPPAGLRGLQSGERSLRA